MFLNDKYIIKKYTGSMAWPTVFLALFIIFCYAATCTLTASKIISLWEALVLNTLFAYLAFTPLHEGCHGSIKGKHKKFTFLGNTLDQVCTTILLGEFSLFKYVHLTHHSFTNIKVKTLTIGLLAKTV